MSTEETRENTEEPEVVDTATSEPAASEAAPSDANGAAGADDTPDDSSDDSSEDDEVSAAADVVDDDDDDDDEFVGDAEPIELISETDEVTDDDEKPQWYILKVQVNREESIRDALERRVKIEGLDRFFTEIVVPTEDVAEFTKTGKRRVVKRKIFPGYIMANMVLNDDTWFLVRETPGIGDFTGSAGKPTPMDPREVERILKTEEDDEEEGTQIKTTIPFNSGDRVRVKEGNFQNFEGDVDKIDEAHGFITVVIPIFGRPTPVEIPHWQLEKV